MELESFFCNLRFSAASGLWKDMLAEAQGVLLKPVFPPASMPGPVSDTLAAFHEEHCGL